MMVRHATQRSNLSSIMRDGLLPSLSQGKQKVCWLHTASKSVWGVLHTIKRHGGTMEEVVVIELDVPRAWLTRSSVKGLWKCDRVIPASRITGVIDGTRFAESPITENC